MEILKQLGDLFLAAVPTAVFVFLFYLFLRWSFFGPIERVVRERDRRIEGARREAEELRKSAQEKSHAYQDALRKARAELDTSATELAEKIARTILEPPRQEYPRPAGEV